MHTLFHIRTVIIPRDRYQPERFSPRVDIGRGMITVLIWKKHALSIYHIFQHWIKKNNINFFVFGFFIFPTNESVSPSETPTNLSSLADIFQTTIDSWAEVTSQGSREAWYRVIRILPRYRPIAWYRCGTSGVYVWAKLTLLLMW